MKQSLILFLTILANSAFSQIQLNHELFNRIEIKDSINFKLDFKTSQENKKYLDSLMNFNESEKAIAQPFIIEKNNYLLYRDFRFLITNELEAYVVNCIPENYKHYYKKDYLPNLYKIIFICNTKTKNITDTIIVSSTSTFVNPINSGNQIINTRVESTLCMSKDSILLKKSTKQLTTHSSYNFNTIQEPQTLKEETYKLEGNMFIISSI